MIQGAEDLTAPPSLARALIQNIHAPTKRFLVVPDAGHFAVFTRPDAFLDELTTVLDFARKSGV